MTARAFKIFIGLVVGLCLAGLPAQADSPLLVTVGEVTDTSAVVWARGFGDRPLTAEYFPATGGAAAVSISQSAISSSRTGSV
jgi:hypothetical protein